MPLLTYPTKVRFNGRLIQARAVDIKYHLEDAVVVSIEVFVDSLNISEGLIEITSGEESEQEGVQA